MADRPPCPICKTPLNPGEEGNLDLAPGNYFGCARCGKYMLARSLRDDLPTLLTNGEKISLLSHAVWKMQRSHQIPKLDLPTVEQILKTELPSLTEQVHNLILWLGDCTEPGIETLSIHPKVYQTIMGAKTPHGATFVLFHLDKRSLVERKRVAGSDHLIVKMTMEGWQYYDNIKRGALTSRKVFMAMKFGDADLNWVFENCFKPAVKATGFELYRLDEKPQAGLIDDRLRVEIRTSRFLISDLTHENAGAYWEAGFAEGLGKPVIYTCEKEKFNTHKTHFDTNHHLTIIWEKEKPEETISALKNTVRATLPDEAILTDE